MEQYINKNEVENILSKLWKEDDGHNSEHRICYNKALQEVQCEIDTIEVKEVDLEKEVHSQMDLLCNLLCYMDELSNGDSEGIYPLPEKVIEDLQRFARHFFELGLRKSITEEDYKIIWKPSDEQMKAFSAMKRYCEIATSFNAYTQGVVESLYQDLKKLKEK